MESHQECFTQRSLYTFHFPLFTLPHSVRQSRNLSARSLYTFHFPSSGHQTWNRTKRSYSPQRPLVTEPRTSRMLIGCHQTWNRTNNVLLKGVFTLYTLQVLYPTASVSHGIHALQECLCSTQKVFPLSTFLLPLSHSGHKSRNLFARMSSLKKSFHFPLSF
jgi:hypothetical protein